MEPIMTEFTSHAPGTPNWVDLMATDLDGAKAFYENVFGWELEDQFDDDGNRIYVMARQNGKAVAGVGEVPSGMQMPSLWNSYIATDDLAATAEVVTAAGGSVKMAPMQVMDAGHMAVFADPTGAAFSAWQPEQHIGVELGNVENTYSWNELMTRDLDSAKAFYSDVFGWRYDVQLMPMGEYSVISGGENGGLGGMMTMPAEVPEMVPNHWAVYFTVSDLEASVAAVGEHGGQVIVPPMDIPGVGKMATVHDPNQASFTLMQAAEQALG